MTQEWQPWLPPGAAMPAAAVAALAELCRGWSRTWFADAHFAPDGALTRGRWRKAGRPDLVWHRAGDDAALGITGQDLRILGELILALPPGSVGTADHALLERLGSECLTDLRGRLREMLLLPPGSPWETGRMTAALEASHGVDIGGGALPLLRLQVGDARFMRLVHAHLPQSARPAPLGSARDALAAVSVELSAELGRCGLTLAEFQAMACGDVLVLGQPLDASLPLVIGGTRAPRGRAVICDAEAQLALRIVEPLA